jgi:uncharacterized membrane protein
MAGVTTIRWCNVAKSVNNPGRKRRLDQPLERSRARRPTYDPEVFGAMSERVARRIGSWAFIAWMTVVVITWIGWNVLAPDNLKPDIFPFIFLTLLLSLQASYAAPLILLAQNRQTDRDRVQFQEDRTRNERILADSDYLAREIADVRDAMGELATRDYLRGELRDLLEEISARLDRIESAQVPDPALPVASDNDPHQQ